MSGELSEAQAAHEAAVMQNAETESLTKSKAWGRLVVFIEEQTTKRMLEVMTSCVGSPEELARRNFATGEASGLNLIKVFVENELQVGRDAVALYRQSLAEAAGGEE